MRWFALFMLSAPTLAHAQDADGDGILDTNDNCLGIHNPTQDDSNVDGFGDACVDPTATVAADLILASGASIHARATVGTGVQVGVSSVIARQADIGHGSTLQDDVVFGRTANTGTSAHLGDFVSYGYGASAGNNLALAPHVVIGSLAQLGSDVTVGTGAVLARGVQLADNVDIGAGTVIGPDARRRSKARIDDRLGKSYGSGLAPKHRQDTMTTPRTGRSLPAQTPPHPGRDWSARHPARSPSARPSSSAP